MATPDEVLQALIYARRAKSVALVTFDTEVSNGFFVTFAGKKILEFDNNTKATQVKNALNSAIAAQKTSITNHYQAKIDGIV